MKKAILAIVAAVVVLGVPARVMAEEAKADLTLPAVNLRQDQERLALIQTNPQAFLEWALKNYQSNIKDYTCTFIKQEFVRGSLTPEQEINVKFREGPFAVFMQWIKNPSMVDKVLYVRGFNENQAMVKPAGFLGWFVRTHVNRPVDGPDSTKVSRRRLDQFGFANALKMIMATNRRALKNGELKFSYTGPGEIDGRKTLIFERFLPDKPTYPDHHMVVHIDQEWLVPVATYCFDAQDNLLGKYIYHNVKLNVGLAFKEFTAASNGL
jgi:hypothetical protein